MEVLSDGVTLARALVSLERAAATCVVAIASPRGRGRIRLHGGAIDAVSTASDADVLLGDLLLESRELDHRAYERALAMSPPTQPVGRWLVEAGAASVDAVRRALQLQVRSRVATMLEWPSVAYELLPARAGSPMRSLGRRLAVAPLVLEALRRHMSEQPAAWLERQLAGGPYEMLPWARRAFDAVSHDGRHTETLATSAALKWLGGLRPAGASACSLMLRKRAQLRRGVQPNELLGLQPGASTEQARRALRRLARDLHPDRLGPHAPPSLRAASTQILSELSRAEHVVRSHPRA